VEFRNYKLHRHEILTLKKQDGSASP